MYLVEKNEEGLGLMASGDYRVMVAFQPMEHQPISDPVTSQPSLSREKLRNFPE